MHEVWDIEDPEPAITHAELLLLYDAVLETDAEIVVELGTETGNSTLALLMALEHTGGTLFSYDTEPCERAHERVNMAGLHDAWQFTQQHSLYTGWRGPIDVLWIDASHEYNETMGELALYEPWVLNTGRVLMHDTDSMPDVNRAIRDYFADGERIERYSFPELRANGTAVIHKGERQ